MPFHIHLRISLSMSTKYPGGILIGNALNQQINLRKGIFNKLILPNHDHSICISIYLSLIWFLSSAFYSIQHINPVHVLLTHTNVFFLWTHYKWHCAFNFGFCMFIVSIYKWLTFMCWSCILWSHWSHLLVKGAFL